MLCSMQDSFYGRRLSRKLRSLVRVSRTYAEIATRRVASLTERDS